MRRVQCVISVFEYLSRILDWWFKFRKYVLQSGIG
jgi:hypothetical protein